MKLSDHRLRQFERVLKPFLDVGRSYSGGMPRFPAREAPDERSLFAVQLSRSQPVRESRDLSGGSLFGAGGSVSKGKIRHFNERNFDAVRAPLFSRVGDTRRLASSRRRPNPGSTSRWRTLFDVLLRL